MSKKNITLILSTIIIITMSIGCTKTNRINEDDKTTSIDYKSNPISKDNALNVLKAEYGEMITTTTEDIEQKGDEYIVDVYVDLYVEPTIEDPGHDESHEHEQSMGTHKINIYTGELIKPESNN